MTIEELKKIEYQSWQNGNEWTDEEIDFIISHDCKCDHCDISVSEMNDFPEVLISDDELLCEECYSSEYRTLCPICENSYDIKDGESEYSVITEQDAKNDNTTAGIYYLDELLIPININFLKKIDCGENCSEVYSDKICPDCVSDLVRKENFIKCHGIGTPCLLIKKYWSEDMFKNYTKEQLNKARQRLINERITIRGIIETANKINLLKIKQ